MHDSTDKDCQEVNKLSQELWNMSFNKFDDFSCDRKKAIFNPLNIWYIQKDANEKRDVFKVHLDAPVENDSEESNQAPKHNRIDFYRIKAKSFNYLSEILGPTFIRIYESFLCPIDRITKVEKTKETITIRRLCLTKEKQNKFGLEGEKRLNASRNVVSSLKDIFLQRSIKFNIYSLTKESEKNPDAERLGKDIFFNPLNIAYIHAKGTLKEVQLFDSSLHETNPPVYSFDNRKSLDDILGLNIKTDTNPSGCFIQISRNCFINIYCFIREHVTLKYGKLSFQLGEKKVILAVGRTYNTKVRHLIEKPEEEEEEEEEES